VAKVLYWVFKGKTNNDIGDILGSSPMTANKHLERIFVKIDVEIAHRSGCHGHGTHTPAAAAV